MQKLDKFWKKSCMQVKVIIYATTDFGSIIEVTFLQG